VILSRSWSSRLSRPVRKRFVAIVSPVSVDTMMGRRISIIN